MLSVDWLLQLRAQIRLETGWADLGPSLLLSQPGFFPADLRRALASSGLRAPGVHRAHNFLRLPELCAPCGVDEETLSPPAARLGLPVTLKGLPARPPRASWKAHERLDTQSWGPAPALWPAWVWSWDHPAFTVPDSDPERSSPAIYQLPAFPPGRSL